MGPLQAVLFSKLLLFTPLKVQILCSNFSFHLLLNVHAIFGFIVMTEIRDSV
jgi:predicted membrane metal-binding protein